MFRRSSPEVVDRKVYATEHEKHRARARGFKSVEQSRRHLSRRLRVVEPLCVSRAAPVSSGIDSRTDDDARELTRADAPEYLLTAHFEPRRVKTPQNESP